MLGTTNFSNEEVQKVFDTLNSESECVFPSFYPQFGLMQQPPTKQLIVTKLSNNSDQVKGRLDNANVERTHQ